MKNESIINPDIHYRIINQKQKHPDPKKHQLISFLKSSVRLTGYGALLYSIGLGVFILIISEIIGIIEELV
jgi:hypothetical protein